MGRLALLLALLVSPAASTAPAGDLIVFGAASLKDPFARIAAAFEAVHPEAHVILNAAGSQELRAQIEHGARADLFASADRKQIERLAAAGTVETPIIFACNQLVLITRPGLNAVATLGDLPRAERIVIGAPEVPIGAYTTALLARAATVYGADFPGRVQSRVASRELNVRQVLAKVVLGEADAAIVYASDAAAARDKLRVIELPASVNVRAEYPVAVVRGAAHDRWARSFIDVLRGPVGARALQDAGFVPCPTQ